MVSFVLLLAPWFLDRRYYYKMLIATVDYGERFKKQLMQDLNVEDDGVTSFISARMPRSSASLVSSGFYFLVGAVIVMFLVDSFLQ
jgi:hypothetical protein